VERIVKKEQTEKKQAVVEQRDCTPRTTGLELETTAKALLEQDKEVAIWSPSK
jgi:hypothetical protein